MFVCTESKVAALKVLAKALEKMQNSAAVWTLYVHVYAAHASRQQGESIKSQDSL